MEKIKFITDSACDLPQQAAQELGIEVLPIPIAVDGKGYREREDFTAQEFYKILLTAGGIPVTSHIPSPVFVEQYEKAFAEGYTHILVTTINSKGSNMFDAATMAKQMFFEEYPQARDRLEICIIDSKTYTIPYGYAQQEAAKMARAGRPFSEITAYLHDFFDRLEIYFAVYSLDFAKKSGRISCAAAFVGEVLGLRPVISIIDGEMKIIEKVRGDKNVAPKVVEYACAQREPQTPILVIRALTEEVGEQALALMEQKTGEKAAGLYYAGASITINAGPRLVAVAVLGKKRSS